MGDGMSVYIRKVDVEKVDSLDHRQPYAASGTFPSFEIFQQMSGAPDWCDWIRHRIYEYDSTNNIYGWNGTRCGMVATKTTYTGDGGGWKEPGQSVPGTNWATYGTLYTHANVLKWTRQATPTSADTLEHDLPAGTTAIGLNACIRNDLNGSAYFEWEVDSQWIPVTLDDVILLWSSASLGSDGLWQCKTSELDSQVRPQHFVVPDGATKIRIRPTGDMTYGQGNFYLGDLDCYVSGSTVPGDAGWNWLMSRLLQSETTSDDIVVSVATAGYLNGPAHTGYEYNMNITVTVDGGAWTPEATVASGNSIVVTMTSDVHDSSGKFAELTRVFTFTGSQVQTNHTWKCTNATHDAVQRFYTSAWSSGIEPVNVSGTYLDDRGANDWQRFTDNALTCLMGHDDGQKVQASTGPLTTCQNFETFGFTPIKVTQQTEYPAKAFTGQSSGRKIYCSLATSRIEGLALNEEFTATNTYGFSYFTAGAVGGTTVIDQTLTLSNEQLEVVTSSVCKVKSSTLTIATGSAEKVSFTSYKDSAEGAGITFNDGWGSYSPYENPAAGDWAGLVQSGGTINNSSIKYATTGLTHNGGQVESLGVNSCTTSYTGADITNNTYIWLSSTSMESDTTFKNRGRLL